MLGSNGAGKTTIVKILTTLLKPDGETTAVNGFGVALPQDPRQIADDSLKRFGLTCAADRGMRRRLLS